jgi:predicted acyltransferase
MMLPGHLAVAPSAAQRDPSLDAFRGLAVGGMILVNLQGNGAAAWAQAVHAAWHGLTLADLVFPYFLLAVGMSAALLAERGIRPSAGRILKRAGLLFLIGLALSWLLRPSLDPDQLRVAGVLQRIAICFAGIALWSRLDNRWTGYLGLACALLLLHSIVLHQVAPGELVASLDPGKGLSAWSDRLLPGRLHGATHDPEGVLSTLSALATTACGAAAWRLRSDQSSWLVAAFAATLIAAALAMVLALSLPFNKALWTPSFGAFSAGSGILVWLLVAALTRRSAPIRVITFLAWMGRVALTFYVVHMVLIVMLRVPAPAPHARLWDLGWTMLSNALPGAGFSSMTFAVIAGGLCLLVTRGLQQRGWLLRV